MTNQAQELAVQPAAYHIGHPGIQLQEAFDVSVVIPTILRPTLRRALESVFTQDFKGRTQILVGIDKSTADRKSISEICRTMPAHCVVTVMDLGYSTSVRHGGLHPARDGGTLRTALSYLANSRYVSYLDDDNWWDPNHLSTLLTAIERCDWAFSLRWFVDPESSTPLCIDQWESTGIDCGVFADQFGGFVDPNCLMLDKLRCEPVLRAWSIPVDGDKKAMSADRNVFRLLRENFRSAATQSATCKYVLDPNDGLHPQRMEWIRAGAAPENASQRVTEPWGKIFGIGLSRTGTTSLTEAFRMLGYTAVHFPTSLGQIDHHDASTDTPVAANFGNLDQRYPNSKFILTIRDKPSWLESCEKFWRKNGEDFEKTEFIRNLHATLYGSNDFDPARFSAAYDRHIDAVGEFFRDRPNDLLTLDVFTDGDPWAALCDFLETPRQQAPFPHQNRSSVVDALLTRLLAVIGDVKETATVANVSVAYIDGLRNAGIIDDLDEPMVLDGGLEANLILRRIVNVKGDDIAARIVNGP